MELCATSGRAIITHRLCEARRNPLSYQVDALRALMVTGSVSVNGVGLDFTVVLLVTAGLVALAARLYPNVIQ